MTMTMMSAGAWRFEGPEPSLELLRWVEAGEPRCGVNLGRLEQD